MNSRTRAARLFVTMLLLLLWGSAVVRAQDEGEIEPLSWPRALVSDSGTITMYQPEIESFKNDVLESRAAISVQRNGHETPVFGAVWISSRMSTDLDTRTVGLEGLTITAARIPGIEGERLGRLTAYLEREIPLWDLTLSLDRLLAGLETLDDLRAVGEGLKHDPPEIYYRTSPFVLVVVDGDPIMHEVEGSRLERVVNTPFFIVRDPSRNALYLRGGDFWYSARSLDGEWMPVTNPPDDVADLATRIEKAADQSDPAGAPDTTLPEVAEPPAVILTKVPAELIQTDGEPELAPVEGTSLLYVKNSENDILLNIESQTYFVLISGRWFTSPSLADGPWTHVPPDQVPEEFKDIPEGSDMASVLAAVAGTPQAREAVLESLIPQTAEVERSKSITVEYDGDPRFEPIEGTEMQYAVNTAKSVLQIDGVYYCCDDAVWYRAERATGPWAVATSVPADIQDVPPDSPVYNTKYVYIYDTTTTVVYVGYTPGYTGVYYYGGCVVYGTGWWYRPWYHTVYYPRPVTWGFGVHYNPWTGWGFTFGVSYGWLHISYGWGGYPGWWGAAGYRNGYRHGYARGYYHGRRAGYAAGYRAGQRPATYQNKYRNQSNVRTAQARAPRASTGSRPGTGTRGGSPTAARTPTRSAQPNNVYSDRNGNTYRKQGNEWQTHDNRSNTWSPAGGSDRSRGTGQGATPQNRSQQDLNRQSQARDRGNRRATGYNRSRSSASGGARRGGGRRR